MAYAIRMPALGQTTDELMIVVWLKAEGDGVKIGEPLFSVETDKTTLEVESAFAGTLLKIVHPAQATVHTGAIIAYVGVPGEAIPPDDAAKPNKPESPEIVSPQSTSTHATAPAGKVLATPAARQLAKEHGIDLALVKGSGPGGRIEKEDVRAVIDRN